MRAMIRVLTLVLSLTAGSQAAAQPRPRALDVPAANSWQHAQTRMILPPEAAGLTRREIGDLGEGEMDVVAQYDGPDGVIATVYLFRTATPDVSLWFDRAMAMIALRPEYGLAGVALPAPTSFTRPGARVASGLRVALDVPGGQWRSTALALAPLGDHLLKIRFSSTRLDRAALDERLTPFVEALRWPPPPENERAGAVIQPCAEPLRLRNARVLRAEMSDTLMDAIMAVPIEGVSEQLPPVYCREPGATVQYGVYRPDGSRSAYLIALNDAGIALSLAEAVNLSALLGEGGGRRRISMMLLGREMTSMLPSFNRLPPPAQAISVAFDGGSVISVTTDRPRD